MLSLLKKHSLWLLIILGSFVWSLTTVKSGLLYDYGRGFWGPHGHDGIWHISLINSLARGSWDMPIFSGFPIKNYHLGFDLFVAAIHKITSLPVSTLYFQILPPIFALVIGLLTYKVIHIWTRSTIATWWSVFFVYFGGSLGWVLSGGESTFWSQQAISTLINPPFALSLILILTILLLLLKNRFLLAGLVLVLLPHVKIYAGLLMFAALLLASLKNRKLLLTLLVGLPLFIFTNYPLFITGSSLIVWQPGWFLENMMGLSDRLNWQRFFSAMTTYRMSQNWLKGIPAYVMAFGVFLLGNLGTRLIAISITSSYKWGSLTWLHLLSLGVVGAGAVIPMFFLQSGTPWNTIQFFYYSLFFASLLAGPAIHNLYQKTHGSKLKTAALYSSLIVLTIPTTLEALNHYLPSRPPAQISTNELEALEYLASLPQGVVLAPPANPNPYAPAPRPLYLYESTAYVSAFSNKPSFLEDEVNLNITGYDWPARRSQVDQLFSEKNSAAARKFLQENNIAYIYLPEIATTRPVLSETDLNMVKLFENSTTSIWGK